MPKKEENKIFSKRNIISFFIILVMVSSILAIWKGSSDTNTTPDYNDHKVKLENNKYVIDSDFGEVSGYNYPSFLETIPLNIGYVNYILSSNELYILFDPHDENLPVIEVMRSDLAQQDFYTLGKAVGFAVTAANETYPYPVLACNATALPTLYLHTHNLSNATIYQDHGCIVLEASSWQDLLELKDRFVYTMYGVMD